MTITEAIDQIGLQVMNMTVGEVEYEVSKLVGRRVTYAEIVAALPSPPVPAPKKDDKPCDE